VQLQDIKVPDNLQDALSRMAQAERERQARVILGESEVSVARMFAEAGEVYKLHPTALHLRGMNMLYETMRSGGANVIMVPSSALDTMNLGTISGLAGLARGGNLDAPLPPPDGGEGQNGPERRESPPSTASPQSPFTVGPFSLPGTPPDSGQGTP
jgi:regulator of protease activity HflC (stomatin/prohibitin superfamily)